MPIVPLKGGDGGNAVETDPLLTQKRQHASSMHNIAAAKTDTEFSRPPKSYSVSADGSISYLTPVQLGRHELYEAIPFTAVFGLQRKERNLSRAFASYAAELDVLEHTTGTDVSDHDKEQRRSKANLLILDEFEHDKDIVSTPLIIAVLVAALSQFSVGYNTGVMNAPEHVIFVGHSTGSWSMAVAAFAIGGPFGAMIAGALADKRGRRGALLIDTWTFLLGGVIQTCALDMFSLIISRFIIGFACGLSSVLVPIYLGELAPPTLRGMLGTLTQFALVIGIMVANFMAFPFATLKLWRCLFAMTPLIAVVQLLMAPFLLESPRWLLNRDAKSKRARFIIKKIRGLRYDSEVETEVDHFVAASKIQDDSTGDAGTTTTTTTSQNSVVYQMFTDKKVRMLVISTLVLQISQQLSGINAVFYYSNMFFDGVLSNPTVGTTIVGGVNVLATYVALLLMDSCGRRTLILWSSGGMLLCVIVIVLALLGYFSNFIALAGVILYVSFFEIGLGPIPWLIVAEMFDTKYVATAMSVSCQLNWACNFIVGIIFPYLNKYLGPYSFVPFGVVLAGCFIFALIWLPETQGTTPAELQAQLSRKHSHTVYKNFDVQNSIANPIDLEWRLAMDQIRQEEEAAMKEGRYNYGFSAIDDPAAQVNQLAPPDGSSSWQATMMGGVK
mmetsp:Transcript_42364/g.51608  ORF Transcript_42364/g.51608 Transcript_42364/m.51608 type:complete len:670 (-) Transcript_42364:299-2308(-)|eukprot:CAMPEP_0172501694 /NCGR_PEP_ID=MMETSP1066-20121228/152488_1 /TAXON_ID=671091 /ORGANISM="Coscinodiscus wailesii, Strain CCMP2513" /LENGTH=669 /DNA_ID=CAMNT_0013276635 /DNA_START=27 /DNA_END=2036 /DNA_ORIENTATION=+